MNNPDLRSLQWADPFRKNGLVIRQASDTN